MSALGSLLRSELLRPVATEVVTFAAELGARLNASAVLFYGSNLRSGDFEGVLDFYVLREHAASGHPLSRWVWPDVSYHELTLGSQTLRAKVATMPLDIFERAAGGRALDTTIWTRFAQPTALVWSDYAVTRDRVIHAVQRAVVTASRFAILDHVGAGRPTEIWEALFRATYDMGLRIERPGRKRQLIAAYVERYERLLPLAWGAGGIDFERRGDRLEPSPSKHQLRVLWNAWLRSQRAGRWINAIRLLKAAATFDGGARYGRQPSHVERLQGRMTCDRAPKALQSGPSADGPTLHQARHERSAVQCARARSADRHDVHILFEQPIDGAPAVRAVGSSTLQGECERGPRNV